ncbi:O-antigen ligase family protein, partial [Aquipuribacter hungaricus]
AAAVVAPGGRQGRRADGRGPAPLPSWPVDALLWGFPVWWVLGLTPFVVILFAGVMALLLVARGRVSVLRGTGPWYGYVLWVGPCALALDNASRFIGFGQRWANLLATAVVVLYVSNARERLPSRRVVGGLVALWVVVVVGGYLGVLWPGTRLTTPVGLLLPGAITGNSYVQDLVFPPFAEVQQPYGAPEPYNRPSAPFPYANGWGSAIALLTPVAVAAVLMTPRRRTRTFVVLVMVAASVPMLASLNRGMFLALGVAVVYVMTRLLLRGRVWQFAALVVAGCGALGAFAASGLFEGISSRTTYSSTNVGRMAIYQETFERTLASPVIGYGAPRPSEILDISAGTQGHFWMVMFSYGFVGLGFFLWFLWGATVRTAAAPTTAELWLHATLVVASMTIFYYGLDTMQMLAVTLVAVVLLRGRVEPATAPAVGLAGATGAVAAPGTGLTGAAGRG